MSTRRNIEPYDEENDDIAKEKKKIKEKMAAEAIEEAKKEGLGSKGVTDRPSRLRRVGAVDDLLHLHGSLQSAENAAVPALVLRALSRGYV